MHPCFICTKPATSFRSLTQLTAPPTDPTDSVPICSACQEHWSASLIAIIRMDLQQASGTPLPPGAFRHTSHPQSDL